MKKVVWGEDPNFSGPRDWFRNTLVLREVLRYKKKGKLLDFGCGVGNLLIRFSSYGFECTGVDSSRIAIKNFKKRLGDYNIKSVEVRTAHEPFLFKGKDKFDVIVSGETLEHLKNDELAIRGFYRCLKKGGVCLVTVPAHPERWSKVDEYAGHYRRYRMKDLVSLFKKQSFSILNVFYWGFPVGYFWDKFFLYPLFTLKTENNFSFTKINNPVTNFLLKSKIKLFFSIPFWIDNFFNWTKLGVGLILVARK